VVQSIFPLGRNKIKWLYCIVFVCFFFFYTVVNDFVFTFSTLCSLALLEEKVLYRTLKGSISATYLEPLKGSIHS